MIWLEYKALIKNLYEVSSLVIIWDSKIIIMIEIKVRKIIEEYILFLILVENFSLAASLAI